MQLDTVRLELLYSSLKDGEPTPALIGITARSADAPRKLAVARLKVEGWQPR